MDSEEVFVDKQDHIAVITLNRPRVLNALTESMLRTLPALCEELSQDDDIRVVILTGAGRGFCSGGDLTQIDLSRPRRRIKPPSATEHLTCLLTVPKPTIAAVNGIAAGGGLALALACDIRIASEEARFSAIWAKAGMPAVDGVGWILPRIVGLSKALELIFTAATIDAHEAERIGLASLVVPSDQLLERAKEMAERMAAGPPVALALSKSIVYTSLETSYIDYLSRDPYYMLANATLAGHDVQEGARAFREKREPKFQGWASDR